MFVITTGSGTQYRVTETHVFRMEKPVNPAHCHHEEIVAEGTEALALSRRCDMDRSSLVGHPLFVGIWMSTKVQSVVRL